MAVTPKRARGKPVPSAKRGKPAKRAKPAKCRKSATGIKRGADFTPEELAKARRLHYSGAITGDIAAMMETTPHVIRGLIVKNGWPPRGRGYKVKTPPPHLTWAEIAAGHDPQPLSSPLPAGTKRAPDNEADLVQRLYNALDETLEEIVSPAGMGAIARGDLDKKTRAIASMVRSLEKVLEIKVSQAKANDTSGGANAEKVRIDAEQLRRDIAERLERLQRKRDAHEPSK